MITALPVVVPLAVAAFVGVVLLLRRRAAATPLRVVVGLVACGYGAGVVANTVFPIYLEARASGGLPWTTHLNLVPLVNTEAMDMATNVAVFVPLGFLLPLLLRVRSVGWVVVIGFPLSLTMELVQLVNALTGHGGHIADVNDLLANAIGAPIGYGLYRLAVLVPVLARVAAAATWPRSVEQRGRQVEVA